MPTGVCTRRRTRKFTVHSATPSRSPPAATLSIRTCVTSSCPTTISGCNWMRRGAGSNRSPTRRCSASWAAPSTRRRRTGRSAPSPQPGARTCGHCSACNQTSTWPGKTGPWMPAWSGPATSFTLTGRLTRLPRAWISPSRAWAGRSATRRPVRPAPATSARARVTTTTAFRPAYMTRSRVNAGIPQIILPGPPTPA